MLEVGGLELQAHGIRPVGTVRFARRSDFRSQPQLRQCAFMLIAFAIADIKTDCIEIGALMTADTPPNQIAGAS